MIDTLRLTAEEAMRLVESRESRRDRIIHGAGSIASSQRESGGTKPRSSVTCCSAIHRTGIVRPSLVSSVTPNSRSHSKTPSVWCRNARCRKSPWCALEASNHSWTAR